MRSLTPRGPVSATLLTLLNAAPPAPTDAHADSGLDAAVAQAVARTEDLRYDDDLQLALYCRYALHLHGLDGVDDAWEWHPALAAATARLERAFERALREATASVVAPSAAGAVPPSEAAADVVRRLHAITEADLGPSLSRHIARRADATQFADFLRYRSVYQLKEADPHTLAIPRLRGRAKSALVEIQADEYGNGIPDRVHSTLFAATMRAAGLDDALGSHVDDVPAIVLANDNAAMLFGLHRRLRGAAVGHLAALEMTSSIPMRLYERGAGRLGYDEAARAYFAEHVEVDAVHEQVAIHDMVVPLVTGDPRLAGDVLLGAATCMVLGAAVTNELFRRWHAMTPAGDLR